MRKNQVGLQRNESLRVIALVSINSASSGLAQRVSIRMLRPSDHPSFWIKCSDEGLSFPVALGIPHQHADPLHPVRLLRTAATGHVAAALPRSVMNSRRCMCPRKDHSFMLKG